MSWLGGNWYGVVAVFGVPATLGVFCWVAVHNRLGAARGLNAPDRTRANFPACAPHAVPSDGGGLTISVRRLP